LPVARYSRVVVLRRRARSGASDRRPSHSQLGERTPSVARPALKRDRCDPRLSGSSHLLAGPFSSLSSVGSAPNTARPAEQVHPSCGDGSGVPDCVRESLSGANRFAGFLRAPMVVKANGLTEIRPALAEPSWLAARAAFETCIERALTSSPSVSYDRKTLPSVDKRRRGCRAFFRRSRECEPGLSFAPRDRPHTRCGRELCGGSALLLR